MEDDLEVPVQKHCLFVARDEIGKLRIGVRAAGISTGEFETLALRRRQSSFTQLILAIDGAHSHALDEAQHAAAIVSLFLEQQRQLDALAPIPLQLHTRFAKNRSIQDLDQNWCWTELRFRAYELFRMSILPRLSYFDANAVIRLDNGMKFSGETIFIIGMYAMMKPHTQEQIAIEFGVSNQSIVSRVVARFCDIMLEAFDHLIRNESDDAFQIWRDFAGNFVSRVRMQWPECPAGMEDVGCFVDGSANYTCRPGQRDEHEAAGVDTQRAWYNSYYGNHGQKFQGVVAPNGLFLQMWGPVSIRVHDSPLVMTSRLNQKLVELSQVSGVTIKAHGDSAYPRRSHLVKNSSYMMSQKRICNEWAFGKMQQICAVTDFEANLKVRGVVNCALRGHFFCAGLSQSACQNISRVHNNHKHAHLLLWQPNWYLLSLHSSDAGGILLHVSD
jgi:hypothetical protein